MEVNRLCTQKARERCHREGAELETTGRGIKGKIKRKLEKRQRQIYGKRWKDMNMYRG